MDLLETVDPEALEQSAKDYMSELFYRNPGIHETLRLPDSREVRASNYLRSSFKVTFNLHHLADALDKDILHITDIGEYSVRNFAQLLV